MFTKRSNMHARMLPSFHTLSLPASTLNIITTQTSLSIVFGQTGRLNCSAVGGVDTLPLTLTWSTTANVSISRVVRQQSVAMVADTLTLPSVNTSYRGVYTCVVSDAIRRVQSSILVNVTGSLLNRIFMAAYFCQPCVSFSQLLSSLLLLLLLMLLSPLFLDHYCYHHHCCYYC